MLQTIFDGEAGAGKVKSLLNFRIDFPLEFGFLFFPRPGLVRFWLTFCIHVRAACSSSSLINFSINVTVPMVFRNLAKLYSLFSLRRENQRNNRRVGRVECAL